MFFLSKVSYGQEAKKIEAQKVKKEIQKEVLEDCKEPNLNNEEKSFAKKVKEDDDIDRLFLTSKQGCSLPSPSIAD